MQVKEAIGGKEREQLLENDLRKAPVPRAASTTGPPNWALHMAKYQEWLRAAQESATSIGNMPPSSGTLRARAGGVLVRMVRRMLFWYTPQVIGFNTAALAVIQQQSGLIESLSMSLKALETDTRQLRADTDSQQAGTAAASERFDGLTAELQKIHARVDAILPEVSRSDQELLGYIKDGDAARAETETKIRAAEASVQQLRTMLFHVERRLAILLTDLRKSPGGAAPIQRSEAAAPGHELDNLYLMLEDALRGSREEIKSRLEKYIPYLETAGLGKPGTPVLDLGCGRGEWLEILRDRGYKAEGVDLNSTFVAECGKLGLNVVQDDAIGNLRKRQDRSLGAITGFHLVEHLPFATLVELLDETTRVLKPGGLAIFETPNPSNVLVGSHNFYFDPTHRNPLPSLLLEFLVEARGLCDVQILPLHPYPYAMRVPGDGTAITARFNEVFYGPQDYAVIGRKA